MEKIDAIFFIGPQGSGKGTQARKLAEKLDFFYWEMGGVLREESGKSTELGKKVKELIDAGVLLSDDLLLQVFVARMREIPFDKGVIFDGVPRRVGQAEFVIATLKEQHRDNLVTIFLDIPKEEALDRLLKRAEIEHRVDDTQEKIEFRLEQYYNDTVPMLEKMREASQFINIDGRPPIEEVTAAIDRALGIV